jgi:predicted dehydrogenase
VKKEISCGGIIMDNGPHVADLVQHLFGPVSSVSARAWDTTQVGVEDTAKLEFTVAGGYPVTADISWAAWVTPKHYMEIYGREGTLFLDTEGVTLKYKTWNDWKRIPNEDGPEEGFSRQIDHFIQAVQSGRPTVIDAQAGLQAQRLLEAAYRSIAQGSSAQMILSA